MNLAQTSLNVAECGQAKRLFARALEMRQERFEVTPPLP